MNTTTIEEELLNTKELRLRQSEAGRASAGPRRKPGSGDRVAYRGHRQPGRYKGVRNAERNAKIVEQIRRGDSYKQVAARYGLAIHTVRFIERYYLEDDE